MSSKILPPSLALAALLLGGCTALGIGGPDGSGKRIFELEDQPRGDSVTLGSVTLLEPGYVVVHDDVDGQPGPVLGHTELLDAGTHRDVRIALDPMPTGRRVLPMVHTDDGNGTYEFPGPDAPLVVEGKPVLGAVNLR